MDNAMERFYFHHHILGFLVIFIGIPSSLWPPYVCSPPPSCFRSESFPARSDQSRPFPQNARGGRVRILISS